MAEVLLNEDTMRRLEQLVLASRKISMSQQKGERRSRRRGSSTDFADYRNYVPGDDIRFLDWKIYGRLEKLFIKLFLEEEDLRLHILIDASPSMAFGEPSKLLYAKRVAAALGYICLAKMDTLVVRTFGEDLAESFGPKKGKANRGRFFDFLSSIEPTEGTALFPSFKGFSAGRRQKGIVVILSDFFDLDGYDDALRQLFARDFDVLALHILSPEELKPELEGDLKLVDVEVGLTTDVSMGRSILTTYERTLAAFCDDLKAAVVKRGGHYLLASTANPFERLVLDVLRRRGVVR